MDPRVGQLVADIQYNVSIEGDIDAVMVRNEIVPLFQEVTTESDRVALIETFHLVTDIAARALRADGRDTAGLEAARKSQQRMFCVTEATVNGAADPVRLWRAISREAAAGRMADDDSFAMTARAAAEVLPAKAVPREPAPQRGWWQRTFGA